MKKILCFTLAIVLLLSGLVSVTGMTVSELDPDGKYNYIDVVLPLLEEKMLSEEELYYYHERYEYYSEENVSSYDEATPDYVLISVGTNLALPIPIADVYGDYIMYSSYGEHPFAYGWGVYIPKTQELLGLNAAYEKGIEGIERVFTEAGVGRLIGDMDKDRKLTVKDATYIQKCLTGIIEFDSDDCIEYFAFSDNPPLKYISDFNRDRVRNIKDATAIQKHIAGLAY